MHKQIRYRSLNNYSVGIYEDVLDYIFQTTIVLIILIALILMRVMGIIDLVAPINSRRIKRNSWEWFDGEVAEKISVRDKLFKKIKNQNFTLTNK